MTRVFTAPRRLILTACGLVFLLAATAIAVSVGQRLRDTEHKAKGDALEQVKQAPEQSLRILGNEDCPLRIVEATVKEIPGHLFTKLTGKVTRLADVSSVPEARLINISGQTVTRFFLAVRDPESRTTRGLIKNSLALKPGEALLVTRDDFGAPEKVTVMDKGGQIRHKQIAPGMDSERKWLGFAPRSNLFITIAKVEFADGSSWVIKEGGELK